MPEEVDFWTRYSRLCSKAKLCPLRSIFRRLKGSELCCPVEVIRSEHWPLLYVAISGDKKLTKLEFISSVLPAANSDQTDARKRNRLQFPISYGCSEKNINDLCKCAARLLSTSTELKTLKIENLCLKSKDAQLLEKGFKDSRIENFSLSGCKLEENAFEIICRGLQLSYVQWIDLTSCGLKASDISFVCKIIKAHSLRRSSELFPHTLRYQLPNFDDIKGLNRITLNNNKIGDEAIDMFVSSFNEDVWIKALDIQKCWIGDDGAKSLLNVVQRNAGLQLIDLRQNEIDESILDRITLQMALNNVGKDIQHKLGCLWKPSKIIKRVSCRKTLLKTKVLKYSPTKAKVISKVSDRIPVKMKTAQTTSGEASSQTSINYGREIRKAKKIILKYNNLLSLLKQCKRENHLLQQEVENLSSQAGYVLIDQQTFAEVTSTFEKYKVFLDIMKEYGLWECIALLEENENFKDNLKPLVIEAIQQCIKIAKSDSSSERISHSNESDPLSSLQDEMPRFQKFQRSNNFKQVHQSSDKFNTNSEESKLFHRRVLPEMNHVTKPVPSSKALARKVFREVMESYTSSSNESKQAKPSKTLLNTEQRSKIEILEIQNCISETATKLKQLNGHKGPQTVLSSHHRSNDTGLKVTEPLINLKNTKYGDQESIFNVDLVNTKGNSADHMTKASSLSSIKSLLDGATIIRESDQSSVYKSLPQAEQEIYILPKNNTNVQLPSQNKITLTKAQSSTSSENEALSEGNLKSSRSSKSKISHHRTPTKKPLPSQSNPSVFEVPKSSRVPDYSSSTSSINSYRDKDNLKDPVHSSVNRYRRKDSNKDAIRSSVEGSPVNSYGTEDIQKDPVHSSVNRSRRMVRHQDAVHSSNSYRIDTQKDPVHSSFEGSSVNSYRNKKIHGDVVHSSDEGANSEKSYLESVISEASTDKDVKSIFESEVYSSDSNQKDSKKSIHVSPKDSSVAAVEVHSDLVKKSVKSNSAKSSETKLTQRKVAREKSEKSHKSESSVPSLSDITTVSSHSLNTDSVMGQLSD